MNKPQGLPPAPRHSRGALSPDFAFRVRPEDVGFRVERFEYVPATPHFGLLRLAGRWPEDVGLRLSPPGLRIELPPLHGELAPIADPSGWLVRAADGGMALRTAFAAPLEVISDEQALFALRAHAGLLIELPQPIHRLLDPRVAAAVAHRVRPYSLLSVGLLIAALSPLSFVATSIAADPPASTPNVVVRPDCPPTGVLPDGTRCVLRQGAPAAASQAQAPAPTAAPAQPAAAQPAAAPPPPPAGQPPAPQQPAAPPAPPAPPVRTDEPANRRERRQARPRHRRAPVSIVGKHAGERRHARPRQVPAPQPPPPPAATPAPGGVPALGMSLPAPAVAVPNVFIERFPIPPFLLPIYQAAGVQYGVPWQVLAAINEIESDYGRNLSVSTAGAVGWMQFMPGTWADYGVDANADGREDPYNPADAIFAAARYLRAAGAGHDLQRAIFAYNHADWYVQSVMLRAKLLAALPNDLVSSLTGLTQGHFPVAGRSRYAGEVKTRDGKGKPTRASFPVQGDAQRTGVDIYARRGTPVIAVNDGVIKRIGRSRALGRYVVLEDVYGNTYTYAHLGQVADRYPAPKPEPPSASALRREVELAARDPRPSRAASAGLQRRSKATRRGRRTPGARARARARLRAQIRDTVRRLPQVALEAEIRSSLRRAPANALRPAQPARPDQGVRASLQTLPSKERLFAHPRRAASYRAGGRRQLESLGVAVPDGTDLRQYFTVAFPLKPDEVVLRDLRPGAHVIGGTILGRVGADHGSSGHVHFRIRPAGKGSPLIDPKPILDGWRLLESTAIYRATNPFFGPGAKDPTIGQLLLMSKEALARRVLADPRISIYPCGRNDIRAGEIDRRVLATLELLASSRLDPTVTALKCGHSFLTKSGNVSEHSFGDAVDIGAINGTSITGHQGPGSITETTIRRLLTLQGVMKPHQIISLMTFQGTDNTLSLPDHYNHIHVGFQPLFGGPGGRSQPNSVLKPGQWAKLISRLNQIANPVVPVAPSRYAIRVARPAHGHPGAAD